MPDHCTVASQIYKCDSDKGLITIGLSTSSTPVMWRLFSEFSHDTQTGLLFADNLCINVQIYSSFSVSRCADTVNVKLRHCTLLFIYSILNNCLSDDEALIFMMRSFRSNIVIHLKRWDFWNSNPALPLEYVSTVKNYEIWKMMFWESSTLYFNKVLFHGSFWLNFVMPLLLNIVL